MIMSEDIKNDLEDIKEILKEKEEAKKSGEELATWNPGQGLNKGKIGNDIQRKVW